ncbi:hypothetical protein L9F63_013071, partial [Diploptera punctata]
TNKYAQQSISKYTFREQRIFITKMCMSVYFTLQYFKFPVVHHVWCVYCCVVLFQYIYTYKTFVRKDLLKNNDRQLNKSINKSKKFFP